MIQRTKLEKASDGRAVVNLLSKEDGIKLSGGKEGQVWRITATNTSGTIPLNSHQAKNFEVAKKELIKALESANLLQ